MGMIGLLLVSLVTTGNKITSTPSGSATDAVFDLQPGDVKEAVISFANAK